MKGYQEQVDNDFHIRKHTQTVCSSTLILMSELVYSNNVLVMYAIEQQYN